MLETNLDQFITKTILINNLETNYIFLKLF